MSTASTIRYSHNPDPKEAFHLFYAQDDRHEEIPTVQLELDCVDIVDIHTRKGAGATVTLKLTRTLAQKLGLMPKPGTEVIDEK